jgi:hypothetical protein
MFIAKLQNPWKNRWIFVTIDKRRVGCVWFRQKRISQTVPRLELYENKKQGEKT